MKITLAATGLRIRSKSEAAEPFSLHRRTARLVRSKTSRRAESDEPEQLR